MGKKSKSKVKKQKKNKGARLRRPQLSLCMIARDEAAFLGQCLQSVAGLVDEIVVVDCHGAGGDWSFNSLVPELLDEGCDWVAHHGWGRYTELLEQGCDAALMVGMHACPRQHPRRGHVPHDLHDKLAQPVVQRRLRG